MFITNGLSVNSLPAVYEYLKVWLLHSLKACYNSEQIFLFPFNIQAHRKLKYLEF